MARSAILAAVLIVTQHAAAQAVVRGVVFDSLANAPLAQASVQIVNADDYPAFGRTVFADSLGRFAIENVPKGHYKLGFFHPVLDSLFIAPPLREVVVSGSRAVDADLAVPGPRRLGKALCASDTSAVVMGAVRDTRERAPMAGVSVRAEWVNLTLGKGGFERSVPHLVATTGDNGFFAICNVPRGGVMTLQATRGHDSTGVIELQVPAAGFARRDLSLGAAHVRLAGTVKTADGRPLTSAQVGIAGATPVHTNEAGEWALANVPDGTRMLDVRALSYYPVHQAVDVIEGVPPVTVSLMTLKSVLDTIKVTASRFESPLAAEFDSRRQSAYGRFFTADDLDRMVLVRTSDVLKRVAGIRLQNDSILMRGMMKKSVFDDGNPECQPAIYLDGVTFPGLTTMEIDSWATPDRVKGIEIYMPGTTPIQFQPSMASASATCGAVVIWTKGR